MKKLMLLAMAMGLVLPSSRLFASSSLDSVKDKVAQVAKRAGIDASLLEKEFPVRSALRSDTGRTFVPHVDNALVASAMAAAAAAAKEGGSSQLMDPRATMAGNTMVLLGEIRKGLEGSKRPGAEVAAKLYRAATQTLKYGVGYTHSFRRTEPPKNGDEAKLEIADQLADLTALFIDKAGR